MSKPTSIGEAIGVFPKSTPLEPAPEPSLEVQTPSEPEGIIRLAIERGAPLETLERLLSWRTQLKAERAREAFYGAMAGFQAKCPVITKSKNVMNRDGRTLRYAYAPFEDIVQVVSPVLEQFGLSWRIDAQIVTGHFECKCIVTHLGGHSETTSFTVPIETSNGRMNNVQEFGSTSTYAKRYCFCNALGLVLAGEDDDGNSVGVGKSSTPLVKASAPVTAVQQPLVPVALASLRKLLGSPANEEWLVAWLRDGISKRTGKPVSLLLPTETLEHLDERHLSQLLRDWESVQGQVEEFAAGKVQTT